MSRRTEGTGFCELVCHLGSALGRTVDSALDFLTPLKSPGGRSTDRAVHFERLRLIEQHDHTSNGALLRRGCTHRQSLDPGGTIHHDATTVPGGTIRGPDAPGTLNTEDSAVLCPYGSGGPDEELLSRRAFCSQTTAPTGGLTLTTSSLQSSATIGQASQWAGRPCNAVQPTTGGWT